MTDAYEPDDSRLTPGLEVQQPNYKRDESLPPFVNQDSPPKDDAPDKYPGPEGTSSDLPRKPLPTSKSGIAEGNAVLIAQLDPNRPEIARREIEHSHSLSPWIDDEPNGQRTTIEPPRDGEAKAQEHVSSVAVKALELLGSESTALPPESPDLLNPLPVPKPPSSPQASRNSLGPPALQNEPVSIKIEEPLPGTSLLLEPDQFSVERRSPEVSPLKKFALPPSEVPVQDILPALQTSPPSAVAKSPENHQQPSLPSIQTALGDFAGPPKDHFGRSPYPLPPVSAASPSIPRSDAAWDHQRGGQFVPAQVPPSPYSHLSPASSQGMSAVSSPASQQQPHWRQSRSDITYLTTPNYEPSPAAVKSPATSYPTPTDQTPSSDRALFNPAPPSTAPVPPGTFKCHHPGCTAAPFQTQYLLNSHANVHSQDRPHFCPIEGCPRGVGGKGFKRKNEMIRHGLVHNSPGYTCASPPCGQKQRRSRAQTSPRLETRGQHARPTTTHDRALADFSRHRDQILIYGHVDTTHPYTLAHDGSSRSSRTNADNLTPKTALSCHLHMR
ncbi:uncharacterized protein ACLA_031350 [Aspergillus clavatus NRRL 1]|uniref:C2H2 type zinc finger domain protein n=1 Tax=Aspergillus clavatus (strain ATCC 1007 / CBS 513.65 / DSM 816 / NCTC 3887 / NRRL 1 / QM 1276 / 107) TaxID=344612 RepID=A1CRY1_ASPCL|nr:C2H2 type zinc finger domain protein [Aspergillus clavatus NRRL 1]EAW08402.1 C2H2 type zinc finger domain protein [Aspergillus clavatus NRRL 1]